MKKKMFAVGLASLVLTGALLLSGCGNAGNTGVQSGETAAVTVSPAASADSGIAAAVTESAEYTARDLAQTAEVSEAKALTVSDGETVTVTEAGVYVLGGSAREAQVVVAAGSEDKVQLVLAGLSITNTDRACILVRSADKVFLTSAEGSENSLTVSGKFSEDEDAAVFSRDDLVLNGLGTVTVSSSKDGIRSNDDLKLTGGTWLVTASDTALKAHDSILAWDGSYTLQAGSDGLHAEDNDDDTTGSIVIDGGSFAIRAGDDGIHAATAATVNGGSLTVSAAEGIEAAQVVLNDGDVRIAASDDGVNAGKKSKSLSVRIEINGGSLTIVMGQGDTDGIDSNGDLIITGGTITISGQSPFDYDGTCTHTGGTIIVNGVETDTITNRFGGGRMGGHMGGGMQGGQSGGFGGKRF